MDTINLQPRRDIAAELTECETRLADTTLTVAKVKTVLLLIIRVLRYLVVKIDQERTV